MACGCEMEVLGGFLFVFRLGVSRGRCFSRFAGPCGKAGMMQPPCANQGRGSNAAHVLKPNRIKQVLNYVGCGSLFCFWG